MSLIEEKQLGGVCLNVGCIPTKTLVARADMLRKVKKAASYGIRIDSHSIDFGQMQQGKNVVVDNMRLSLGQLINKHGVTVINGRAQFTSPQELKVIGEKNMILEAAKIIIATGSIPFDVPSFPCDHKKILNSTSALELSSLPKKLMVIGGGYIGCEFSSLFQEMGV